MEKINIKKILDDIEEKRQKEKQLDTDRVDWIAKNPMPTPQKCSIHGLDTESYEVLDKPFKWISRSVVCRECRNIDILNTARNKLPSRYHDVSVDVDSSKLLAGKSILITGPVGSGKTYRLCEILLGCMVNGNSPVRFRTAGQIAREVRESIGRNEYSEYFGDLMREPVLFVDDLGTENATEFLKEFLYNIVNDRYNACQPLVITTNLTGKELGAIYGERLVSRLMEMCEIIKLTGKDRRL